MSEPLRKVAAQFSVKFDASALKNGNKWISKVQQNLKVLGGTVGAGLVVRGITNFTNETTKMFDELSKGARTVAFSRKAFQEWGHTMELAGGSERFFTKYVYFLQRGIGEAVNGLKTYSDAFHQIGLSPKELLKMSPEEQFEKVFTALGNMEDAALRNAAAQRILGRGGRELTVAMKEGFEQHEKNRKELQRLGGVIKDEVLKRSEAFRDRIVILTKALRGLKARALDVILDTIEPMVDWFTEFAGTMNWIADRSYMLETALIALKVALAFVAFWIIQATWPFMLFVAALLAAWLALDDLYTAFKGGKSVIGDWYKAWTGEDIATLINQITTAVEGLANSDLEHWLDASKELVIDLAEGVDMLYESINKLLDLFPDIPFLGIMKGGPAAWMNQTLGKGLASLGAGDAYWDWVHNQAQNPLFSSAMPGPGYIPLGPQRFSPDGQQFNMEVYVQASSQGPYRDGIEVGRGMKSELRKTGHALDGP